MKEHLMEPITSDSGILCFHKSSLRGTCCDYKLSFYEKHNDPTDIIDQVTVLLHHLFETLQGKTICGRLIAAVKYIHVNEIQDKRSERMYYFPSYNSEDIADVDDFVSRHLCKIASRMEMFSKHGSNLLIQNIENIYLNVIIS